MKEVLHDRTRVAAWGAFVSILVGLVAGAFFPGARLWSLNQMGYLPDWTIPLFPGLAASLAIASVWTLHRIGWTISPRAFVIGASGFLVAALAAFVLFRVRSHFLGDGYTMLTLIASDNPLIKMRNFGGMIIPYGLSQLMGGGTETTTLRAYQLVAYVSGGLFVLLAAWAARRLYPAALDRLLFFAGLCSGGHMLLFFGYVENYALFVLVVTAYCLVGMLSLAGGMSRWWLAGLQALALFFHVFGLVLLPATLFVLLADTGVAGRMVAWRTRIKAAVIIGIVLLGVVTVFLIQRSPSSLAFSLMTVREEWFTLDHYTLFSGAHLLDSLNQLVILWPGVLIAAVALTWDGQRNSNGESRQGFFLGLAAVMTLGTAFFFDPKIGMARDWDLYAFAGLPLGLWLLHRMVSSWRGAYRVPLVLFAVAGVTVLAIRVSVLTTTDAATQQIRAYLYMDPIRNHNVWPIMIKYHMLHGDSAAAYALDRERHALLPEERYLMMSIEAMGDGDHAAALQLVSRAASRYRGMPAYHANYGSALLNLGRREEAFEQLKIALALNPYNIQVLANLGLIHLDWDEPEAARVCWERALELEPNSVLSIYGMAAIHCHDGELAPLPELLERGAVHEGMKADFFPMIAAAALKGRDYKLAGRALALARERGFPNQTIRGLVKEHPGLTRYLREELERLEADSSERR